MSKYPNVTAGQVEAGINRMKGYDNYVRFIGGEGEVVFKNDLLISCGLIELPTITERFFAREKFFCDTSREAKVKINHLGKNFFEWFGDKIEDSVGRQFIHHLELGNQPLDDISILHFLGGAAKAEVKLSDVYGLAESQSGLLKRNWGAVSYVRDKCGVLRTIRTSWNDVGFDFGAFDISDPRTWNKDLLLFVPVN